MSSFYVFRSQKRKKRLTTWPYFLRINCWRNRPQFCFEIGRKLTPVSGTTRSPVLWQRMCSWAPDTIGCQGRLPKSGVASATHTTSRDCCSSLRLDFRCLEKRRKKINRKKCRFVKSTKETRCEFHQRSKYSFYTCRSQKHEKMQLSLKYIFTLSGSVSVKAVHRTLMKLTHGEWHSWFCFISFKSGW